MVEASPVESSSAASPLETRLGHRFASPWLLAEALTHPSFSHAQTQRRAGGGDNQRLEFLGDAIVDLCVSERLFAADPDAREGLLTERRAGLVNEQRLALAAKALGLGEHLLLGAAEARAGFHERPGVLADAFEAVTAAIYLDAGEAGMEAARAFVLRALSELEDGRPQRLKPAKARLQELAQDRWKLTPTYTLVPDQAGVVVAEVHIGARLTARGEGQSRREAEQQAAEAALAELAAGGQPGSARPSSRESKKNTSEGKR